MIKRVDIKINSDAIRRVIDGYVEGVESVALAIENNPKAITHQVFGTWDALASKWLLDGWNAETEHIFRLLKDFCVTHFRQAMNPSKSLEFTIGDRSYYLAREPFQEYTDPSNWCIFFNVALLSRDPEAIKHLCAVPENLFEKANLQVGEFNWKIAAFLKALFNQDAPITQLLVDAIQSTDIHQIEELNREYVLDIIQPMLFVYMNILRKDQQKFNAALQEAVDGHRNFWTREHDEKGNELLRWRKYQGWISLALSAACVIAVDNGLKLEVESDFLLTELILSKRQF